MASRSITDLSGIYEDFDKDPYVTPGFTRDAVREEAEVCVIGGGLGGMMAAAELVRRGIRNVRIIDKAGDFGGTWYWNRYPGAACDVESYIYLPYLEETGYMPIEKYSKATEIFALPAHRAAFRSLSDGFVPDSCGRWANGRWQRSS